MKGTTNNNAVKIFLLMLALLAGCSSDDGSKSDSGGETAEQLPSSSSVGADNNQPSSSSVSQNNSSSSNASGSGLCTGFTEGTERQHYGKSKAQFCDERDGKKYVYVEIGEQTWMAENLNYEAEDSRCYDDDPDNCDTYGMLYDWVTAMEICPVGWHLPSRDEWYEISASIDNSFADVLGGAYTLYDDAFKGIDSYTQWWTATDETNWAYIQRFGSVGGISEAGKTYLLSVRCIKDQL